ncbi:putative Mg2+ transporter-C (MgtC) family protein [Cupriavidus sp. OV038]|jgi:putative Mg2+ transporter-C (MgtC) family protein|uniref:MgtC/SapB family protein n=1 Tax=unclassified Cupriavidus TaxID=2640874 RepID=UPI0008E37AE1|nr:MULTISPECIES: MgtC/SapB family protein [unclassified Cupriavidus]SFC39202.1 putative Mg2+ transporter-C (MgtC) family protein [Cupriavidus sp. OV038]SFP29478.1 putative Mg2+ transporter-C (MgtC) family protein [Cupriavidus sp. OV096]
MSLEALQNINPQSLLDTAISLAAAFVLGGMIGYERQYRQRTAGLRTNVLVAVGAAIFVDMANHLAGHDGAVRVVAYVVSGIGFLGAGVIMREEGNVRGLNTAATLWGSAAVGACAGADLIMEAAIGALFVLAANTLLRPVVDRINRQPIDTPAVEVTHTVHVITAREHQKLAMRLLEEALDAADFPTRDLEVRAFGEQDVEIEAVLAAASVEGDALDAMVARLGATSVVSQAFWSASTTE